MGEFENSASVPLSVDPPLLPVLLLVSDFDMPIGTIGRISDFPLGVLAY
jgi:hypothetical protein